METQLYFKFILLNQFPKKKIIISNLITLNKLVRDIHVKYIKGMRKLTSFMKCLRYILHHFFHIIVVIVNRNI